MHSRRSSSFNSQVLFLALSLFVWKGSGSRDVNGSRLVQLNDCTCLGYAQIFECTAFGAGATVWSGTFFDCQDGTSRNEIRLRHSQYGDVESPPHGECNHGAVIANSIGSADNHCYTSQHIVTIGKEMINETIECSHDDLKGRVTVIGQKSLMVTETPYPPPTNIHIESNDSRQITFAWDEVSAQCSSLQYIITAINCGLCPNITADKNVTCDIQSGIRLRTNNACMFAVQTEICGDLLGERSDYVVVHMDGVITDSEGEGDSTIFIPHAGPEMVNAIVIPVIAGVLSTGVLLLVLVVIALIIFMSKQIMNVKSRVNTTLQEDEFVNGAAPNEQEGIYSLLQPSDDNDTSYGADQEEVVVYADIGPSPGEGLRCEAVQLRFQDDKVEYAEVKSPSREPALSALIMISPSQLPGSSMSHSLDLNNLLNQIGSEVASGWYQLGIAVGISKEMLDECSNHAPQEAVIEVLDYWIRNSNPSWEDVAETLNEIGLHELANSLSQGKLPRQLADEDGDKIEDTHAAVTSSSACDESNSF